MKQVQGRVAVTSIYPGGIATNAAKAVRTSSEASRVALQRNFDKYGHSPDDVARAVLKGIEGDRLRVIVGIEAFIVDWLKRLMPVWTHRLFAHRIDPLV
jgi:short-subunit dehydrogenase